MRLSARRFGRRSYLRAVGIVTAGVAGFAGCTEEGENGEGGGDTDESVDYEEEQRYGTLSTEIRDQPNDIGDFEELTVTIDGIWIKPANDGETDGEQAADANARKTTESPEGDTERPETDSENTEEPENGDDRHYIEFDESRQIDLIELRDGGTRAIDETQVQAVTYQFLQLDVSDVKGVIAESGEQADVETPGDAPLKFDTSFEIRPEHRTRFIADVAPQQTGQGKYVIRPVADGTQVHYGDEEYNPDEDADPENGSEPDDDDGVEFDGGDGVVSTAGTE